MKQECVYLENRTTSLSGTLASLTQPGEHTSLVMTLKCSSYGRLSTLRQVLCSSKEFVHCLSMQRFVSKRSSSSVDLDSSSLDDVRPERAAIALSVGVSWPPDRRWPSRGRPGWQQLWGSALQEHSVHYHEFPHGVRLQESV